MIPKKNSCVYNKILSMLLVIIIVSGSLLPSIGIALAKGENESTPFNTNLALNKKVTANNSHESNHVVSNVTDGDSSTRWSTKSTASSTVIVDLGREESFNQINLNYEASYAKDYSLSVSTDNETWTTVENIVGNDRPGLHEHLFEMVSARYVRLETTSLAQTGLSIFEFEVYQSKLLPLDSQVKEIDVEGGQLSPNFDPGIEDYNIEIGKEVESLTITPSLKSDSAYFIIDGTEKISGTSTIIEDIPIGETQVIVTAFDPDDKVDNKKEYVLNIYRKSFVIGSETYENIALGKDVTTPGHTNGYWHTIENIVDGNLHSIGQANIAQHSPWNVQLDLGQNFIIDQIKFYPNAGGYPKTYSFKVSLDGENWTTVVQEPDIKGQSKAYRFNPSVARYVLLDVTAAVDFSAISEIEVYGIPFSLKSMIDSLETIQIDRGQTQLILPSVPKGYEISLVSSSDTNLIDNDGVITPVYTSQETDLVLKIKDIENNISEETPPISVIVPALVDLDSIEELSDEVVNYGETLTDVLENVLPSTVPVTLSDNSIEQANVSWETDSTPAYSSSTPGDYKFIGIITLPKGVTNNNNVALTVSKTITVDEQIAKSLVVTPENQRLPVPQSGTTKRRFSAIDSGIKYENVTWSIDVEKDYISIDQDGLLIIHPSNEMDPGESFLINVTAEDKSSDVTGTVPVTIKFNKNSESAPSPLMKEGYTLFHSSEFNDDDIDRTVWSDYYLRQWATDGDEKARANYHFEDGAIVLKIDEDSEPWSPLDGNVTVSSLVSYEKVGLHKFGGNNYSDSRNIPTFDGKVTTKYGYFEMRAKMPTATDGSHVAWWMVGNQEDQNIFDTGTTIISNQTSEIDVNESPFKTAHANEWFTTYHQWGSDTNITSDSSSSDYTQTGLDPESRLDSEFHNYGMEWDEDGLKFYFDGKLVRTMSVELDHRLETLLSIYTNSWGGNDEGIYPKEFAIDYFRIYKKDDSIGKINDIFFDMSTIPQKLKKPTAGNTTKMKINAIPVDSMHNPVAEAEAELEWYFASDQAFKNETTIPGASIDRKTGEVSITDQIADGTVLRVSAKSKDNVRIRQSYRVIVENEDAPIPTSIFFEDDNNVNIIPVPNSKNEIQLEAKLYDQYLETIEAPIEYSLVKDTPGLTPANPTGINLTSDGKLIIEPNANPGEVFYVHAKSGDISENYIIELAGKSVDLEELADLIKKAKGFSNEDGLYTNSSYEALQTAIAKAEKSLETIKTEEELTKAMEALQSAIDGLEEVETDPAPTVDLSDLEDLLDEAKAVSNEDGLYTKSSYEALQLAIAKAEESLDTIKTEEELTKALVALQTAIDGLKENTSGENIDKSEENDSSIDTEDNKLPSTATQIFNWIVYGLFLIGIGATVVFILNRQNQRV